MSVYKLVCPHCRGKMRIRTSDGEHIFMRTAYLQCTNEPCSWACRATFEMTHELSPSSMPNPNAMLPLAPIAMRRAALPQNDDDQIDMLESTENEKENDHA